jgi:hypothetical protein
MTLTILDPRSGEKVTLWVEDTPVVRQPTPRRSPPIRGSPPRSRGETTLGTTGRALSRP